MKKERWMNNVKGTYDYSTQEQRVRNELTDLLRTLFESYGYNPIETSMINNKELLGSKYAGGAEIMKEVYTVVDQGNRALGLRYDLTVPFAKYMAMNRNELILPFRKYEIGKVFRNGPIKQGRKREFIQADVDVVGTTSIFAEYEFFRMIVQMANRLSLQLVVEFSDRQILSALLQRYGIKESNWNSIILTLDKLKKMKKSDLLYELIEKGMKEENAKDIMDVLTSSASKPIQDIIQQEALKPFRDIMEYVKTIPNSERVRFQFTPSLARGLDVYTGTIWEVFVEEEGMGTTSSIAAGGRYDKIIGNWMGTEEMYPAVGMTFGVDVIMEVLKEKDRLTKKTVTEYMIIPMDDKQGQAIEFSERLIAAGIKVEMDYSMKKIKKILNRANKLKIPFVSIFGEKEATSGKIGIKNMESGVERIFDVTDIRGIVRYVDGL